MHKENDLLDDGFDNLGKDHVSARECSLILKIVFPSLQESRNGD